MSKKALPNVTGPSIQETLPVSKKKIAFRPFVNREKRDLLMAKETDDWDTIFSTLREMTLRCTDGTVDIKDIPIADVAWLYIKMRSQSINNVIQIKTKCENKDCQSDIIMNYNMDGATVKNQDVNLTVMVNDTTGIEFNAPSFDSLKYIDGPEKNSEKFVASLVKSIFDDVEVYDISEYTIDELVDWLDGLDDRTIKKIDDVMKNLPTLYQEVRYKCPSCGHEHLIVLDGMKDFF